MRIPNLSWLSGAALFVSLFATNAALAERESTSPPAGLAVQSAGSVCAGTDGLEAARKCKGAWLRWRLCEQGIRSEQLPYAEVYGCFLRSL